MEAEVCITFTEFGKMQNICNFLVEKLDSSVVISQPQFYHTPGSIENLRQIVSNSHKISCGLNHFNMFSYVKRLELTVAYPSQTLLRQGDILFQPLSGALASVSQPKVLPNSHVTYGCSPVPSQNEQMLALDFKSMFIVIPFKKSECNDSDKSSLAQLNTCKESIDFFFIVPIPKMIKMQ
eukprot:bmy_17396T0